MQPAIDLGHFSLVLAWLLSLYGLMVGFVAASKGNREWAASARNSYHLTTAFLVAAFCSLAVAFLRHDYRYLYVWRHSNNSMEPLYLISAIWGGMDGSMLLWALVMALFLSVGIHRGERKDPILTRWCVPVASAATMFFVIVVTFLTNPFRLIPPNLVPADGNGLNPLLQNPSMLIHPPFLYAGFTGFAVPFVYCFAALLSGRLSTDWIHFTRRATLVAWTFLTCGIILGGNWAYIELGWGGFWAWDPVENASFLPWLVATAYIHSSMVQERRGMLKIWNVSLAILTYLLTVFGTFLTRSGIVQSVHAFAETDVGWVFLLYMGTVGGAGIILIYWRRHLLRAEAQIESLFSRESVFLLNNLLLLGVCFATLWGVMFPVLSEAVTGSKSVVGPPFYNQVNTPLFLGLLFLMGIGPLIAWRRTSMSSLRRLFMFPLLAASVLTLLLFYFDSSSPLAAVSFGLCLFVLWTIVAEFRRGLDVRRAVSPVAVVPGLVGLLRGKPRRYGALLVHFGAVLAAFSITASMAYKVERDLQLKVGDSTTIGRYRLVLDNLTEQTNQNYTAIVASVSVYLKDDQSPVAVMSPERRYYFSSKESTTEVDIRMRPMEDLYIALAGLDISERVGKAPVNLFTTPGIFKVFINPFQLWLWVGAFVMLCGSLIVIGIKLPELYVVSSRVTGDLAVQGAETQSNSG